VEWCTSELLAREAEKKRVENPAWWEEIYGGVVAGGMTMRPQMKRPWSFQPWTMSLSGQNVPRLKLTNGFYVPSIFVPGNCKL
jgi:hypothetical protein